MKKLFALFVLVALTQGAYASKARLIALGEDSEGSQWIDDNRNFLLNAAKIHNHGSYVMLEHGSDGKGLSAGDLTSDADTNAKAEGGFIMQTDNWAYGVYLGNETNTVTNLRLLASNLDGATGVFVPPQDNKVDIYFGGKGSIPWGANLSYSDTDEQFTGGNSQEENSLSLRLGALFDMVDAYAIISLANSAEYRNNTSGNTVEFDGSFGGVLGATYNMSDMDRIFAEYRTFKWDNKLTGATTVEGSNNIMKVGWGRTKKIGEKAHVFMKLSLYKTSTELDYTAGATELSTTQIPMVIGVESEATSWLTLRGSISSNLWGEEDNKKLANSNATLQAIYTAVGIEEGERTPQNSTNVNLGATLHWGNLSIDGLVGTGNDSAGAIVDSENEDGILSLDKLVSRASLTYKF